MSEAPTANRFCDAIAKARIYKLRGMMEGSAFRSHPVFVFRRNILLCNEWHRDDLCFAQVFTHHPVTFKPWCNEPAAYGDPYPHPENGQAVRVYAHGRWLEEGPWRAAILEILDELEAEIAAASDEAARLAKAKSEQFKAAEAARLAALREVYS